jgi:hypothetical protein
MVSKKDIAERIKVLKEEADATKKNIRYKKLRDANILSLIHSHVSLDGLTKEEQDLVNSMVNPAVFTKLEVNKGDKILDLLQEYSDIKDAYARLIKAGENKGLKLDPKTGKFE